MSVTAILDICGMIKQMNEEVRRKVLYISIGILALILIAGAVVYAPFIKTAADFERSKKPSTMFGAFVLASAGDRMSTSQKIDVIRQLNVSTVRAVVSSASMENNASIAEYKKQGFKVVLNINNNTGDPTQPISNMKQYKKNVGTILDTYSPDLVVIENEEANPTYYAGTADDYINELQAAITVAHQKGYKVADGGLIRVPLAYLTWKKIWDNGNKAKADAFAQAALGYSGERGQYLLSLLPTKKNPKKEFVLDKQIAKGVAMTQELLSKFRNTDLDYINFHWYESDGRATEALLDIILYIEAQTGKPAMSNEFGQLDTSPATVTSLLNGMYAYKVPYAIWFSGDDKHGPPPGDGNNPYGLQDSSGVLRSNGVAFKNFMTSAFLAPISEVVESPAE